MKHIRILLITLLGMMVLSTHAQISCRHEPEGDG